MQHKGTKTIETERLVLRRFETDDAKDVYNNWACDDDVNRYMTSTSLTDPSQAQKAVDSWAARYNDEFYHWNITFKADPTVKSAGFVCVVSNDDDAQKAELGYCIGKKWWNKGYMTEAVKAVADYLFDQVGYNRVEVQYDADNPASGRVAQKCGMQYEGTLRQFMNNKGKICDIAVCSILSEER
ncbi:MAG: GNAT family N-acetyltransferase [Ruminococcaceae bacterium]|nr:GNAT family N-acetyltransferase [Oscillospiraceae bacterium]